MTSTRSAIAGTSCADATRRAASAAASRRRSRLVGATAIAGALLLGTVSTASNAEAPAARREAGASPSHVQRGKASIYASRFHNRRMANGARFDVRSASAAHRTLPLGTRVLVRNLENGRSTTVTVEDRGPYVRGRIIDVSPQTAGLLGMQARGVAPVEIIAIGAARPDEG